MKIMTLTSYATQFSLHEIDGQYEWRLDETPDDLTEPNKIFLALFNRYYLPNLAIYEMTPYGTLIKTIEEKFKYLDPKLELLVPEIVHGEGVPEGAII